MQQWVLWVLCGLRAASQGQVPVMQNKECLIADEIVVCLALELLGIGISVSAFVLSPFSLHLGSGPM